MFSRPLQFNPMTVLRRCLMAGWLGFAGGLSGPLPVGAESRLERFERDASGTPESDAPREKPTNAAATTTTDSEAVVVDWAQPLWSLFWKTAGVAFVTGGVASWERLIAEPESSVSVLAPPRALGEPNIAFTRLDLSYQQAQADISAINGRAELGYGPVGLALDLSRYTEPDTDDILGVYRSHLLYRMSFSWRLEIDIGGGIVVLDGNQAHLGSSWTLPVRLRAHRLLALEVRPAWHTLNGNAIADYDAALLLGDRFLALRLGYRWQGGPTESLHGPHAGIAVYF